MKNRLRYLILVIILIVLLANKGQSQPIELWNGNIYTNLIPGNGNYQFSSARYTLFIPKGINQIRGILIHQHGCGMEGTGGPITTDIQYQAFAQKWELAILGPDMYPHEKKCFEWCTPENGSEESLFAALDSLSLMSGHDELKIVPWLLWGHSGGGHWSLSMLNKYPERIIAVVTYSAAFDSTFNYPQAAAKVPVLLRHAGEGDINANWAKCWLTAVHQFSVLRNMNGFASITFNQDQTHNFSYIRYMAIPFFESVLPQRLPLNGSSKLRDMDTTKAWLGDTITNGMVHVYKASDFAGNKLAMSWLPDSTCAAKYQEYITSGTIRDHTAPLAPFNVKIKTLQPKGTEITWEADADIESGIKYFNIYKKDQLLGRYPVSTDFQTFDTNGDNPIPPIAPDMHFQISKVIRARSYKFEITTVNREGLESPKATVVR
jgi:pimeloyl-ACP methyl ester carboxylesterase